MGYDNETDQVDDEARKERERVETDLRRAVFGSDTSKNNSRLSRSPKTEKAILIADEKKKKEEESRTRETLKRAQEALEEHLRALDEELERLRKSLRDLDELEDLIKAGKFDKNDSHHQELLRSTGMSVDDVQAPDALTRTEKQREAFRERVKEIEEKKEYIKEGSAKINQSDLPDHVKAQKIRELVSHGTVAGAQHVWRDEEASEQVRNAVNTFCVEEEFGVESQNQNEMFSQFVGTSFATKAGIGEGIEGKADNIRLEFSKAVKQDVPESFELLDIGKPVLRGPKLPG